MVKVPTALSQALTRTLVLSKEPIRFSYTNKVLTMLAQSAGCELKESVKVDLRADSAEVYTCAEYLSRYLDVAKRIGFSERCLSLDGEGFQVLVAVSKG